MSTEAKTQAKELRAETAKFIEKASPEQLVQIVSATALRAVPLVQSFTNQKADELRTLIRREFKAHADFRGMVIRKVSILNPQAPKPAKEEKAKEKPSKEDKPKAEKQKKEKKEK